MERTLHCVRVVVRTYVPVILYYDQAMGRTLLVACVVVRTYVSSFSTFRPWGVRTYRPLLRSDCGTYVRVILYYDQTVGRTLHALCTYCGPYVPSLL